LPDGLEFTGPPGGSGATSRQAGQLTRYMTFALFGTLDLGDWTCTFNEEMTIATCENSSIEADSTSSIAIPAAVILGPTQNLAEDATIDYTVTSDGEESSYSVMAILETNEESHEDVFTGEGRLAAAHFGAPLVRCRAGLVQNVDCADVM